MEELKMLKIEERYHKELQIKMYKYKVKTDKRRKERLFVNCNDQDMYLVKLNHSSTTPKTISKVPDFDISTISKSS